MWTIATAVSRFLAAAMALCINIASGQEYPTKPIRIITGGGSADLVVRLTAPALAEKLGQPVIIDNRPSALRWNAVSNAPPDGYTLLLAGNTFWVAPLLEKTSYDPVRDFAPVTLVTRSPTILVVHPSVPVKSVKELITLAKARPGALNYGSSGTGSSSHLAAELFKAMAGINILHIPYKSMGAAINDLLGGQVQVALPSVATATPHVKSGRLRALAVTSAQPSALAPDLPTLASTVSGYESEVLNAMFARANTPRTIINRLNQEFVRVLNQADVKGKSFDSGAEAVSSSPEELAAKINSEMTRLGKVIKDAGIKTDP